GLLCQALKLKGRLDETLLIIASDHGLSPTHSHFDSVEFMNQLGFKTLHYPKVYKFFSDADAAIMISGNSMTHIYIKSTRGWQERSSFEELTKVVDQLIERNEVDIVAGIDEKGKVRIKSQRGEATAWFDHDGCIEYKRIYEDPFGYNGLPEKMSPDEALEYTYHTTYPDAIVQILQLLESPRSGDLVVSAGPGYDLRAKYEKPEHCSSHGSLVKEHMLVPTAINISIKRRFLRTVDFYPTILSLLGHDIPTNIDGVNLVN
ncbi:MAG: alkaline phosphatase family protein, partial [Thermodesulfobacteriota bacterium]